MISLSFAAALQTIPKKGYDDYPKAFQDGGGLNFSERYQRFLSKCGQIPRLCLYILQQVSSILGDPDSDDQLFTHLINRVPTGLHRDIPLSNCFTPVADDDTDAPPLSIHFDSCKSAHEDPDVTSRLVQEEIDNHWVDLFPGDEIAAQSHFPTGISVGKLGLAYSDSRPPRLVVDLSVGSLNQQCFIPEKSSLPSAKDILRSYPIRNSSDDQLGLSIDINRHTNGSPFDRVNVV